MKKNFIIAAAIVAAFFIGWLMFSYFSYNNREVSLRSEAQAQEQKIEGVHDKMWKVIQQKAGVASEYSEKFGSVYTHIMSERYNAGDGSLMKWIHEANPEFDSSLYADLSESIEILRTEFQHSQERMIDIVREHRTICSTYPGKWFISNTTPIEYEVISSTRSKTVMQTRLDDEVDVFD